MNISCKTRWQRTILPGWQLTQIATSRYSEFHLTAFPSKNETAADVVERLIKWVKENHVTIVRNDILGGLSMHDEILERFEKGLGTLDWPILWTQGSQEIDKDLRGINIMAVKDTPVSNIKYGDKIVGRSFSDGYARHLLLGNLYPSNIKAARTEQVSELLEQIETILKSALMDYSNIVRTWFYLDNILLWYDDFNKVRTNFFKKRNVFDNVVPASTGISGSNFYKAAVSAGVWAVKPEDEAFSIREVPSPLQCPAPCYGSSFSRAIELANPELKRIFISGTASIDQNGSTAHINNIDSQIKLTMLVVEAILKLKGMDFKNLTRSIAYFKDLKQCDAFERWISKYDISRFPTVITQADVCRDNLLFEIEADAISTETV